MMRVWISLWVFAMALALGGCGVETGERPPTPEGVGFPLTDVTAEAGLDGFRHDNGGFGQAWAPEIVGGGGGFVDYDGDGWLDVVLIGGGRFREDEGPAIQAVRLYRNLGDGTFQDQTAAVGLGGLETYSLGLSMADYDGDGDDDLFVTTLYEDLLLRNDGGTFTDVSTASGLATGPRWSTSALFFDANRDGYLDLFVGSYVDWSPEKDLYCNYDDEKVYCTPEGYEGVNSRFFYGSAAGVFREATAEAGFAGGLEARLDKVLGVAELDFNNDGWPDLAVANDTERDLLYENQGDGTFRERGVLSGFAYDQHGKARAGMGIDAGVVDETGEVTLFVGNFSDETVGVYRHTGGGLFLDRAAAARLSHPSLRTLTFGLVLLDLDLDGDLDLLTANGHVQTHIEKMVEGVTFREAAQLYLNRGDGVFDEVQATAGPLATPLVARGVAYGDYDRDGDLDLLLTENDGPAHLWRNDHGGRFLRVRLQAEGSNREALGARLLALAEGTWMERRIRTGSTYLSQSEKTATFGLGQATQVDSLVVHWPQGGATRLGRLAADQEVVVYEADGLLERNEAYLHR